MQQMNNILLASSAKNSASSSKVMAQETNSEDFSAALASVVSVSETPTKSNLSKDMPVKSGQPESSVDEEQAEDATDINLIFAQIGMANEMKKAAVTGDALPLEGQLTAIEDAASSLSVLAEGGALPAEEATVATFLDELAKFAEPSKDSHVSVTADAAVMTQSVNQTSTSEADTELASQTRTELGTVQTSQQLSQQASSTTEAELTQSFNALTSTANPDISDKIALSDDAEAILGSKEDVLNGKSVNVSAQVAEKTITPMVDHLASNKTTNASATDAQGLSVNMATGVNSKEPNTLGAVPVDPNASDDNPSRAEISAGLLLKDAKLAVALDGPQDNTLPSLETGSEESSAEFKPVEFKAVSTLHAITNQQVHRQEISPVQLSLRQGVENQNQMQEMIQRFSPVMKQQLVTMVSQGIQQAEIRLDPPELGHMLVKIQVHGDQTQVQFHVTQSQTRDLVEQAIPRLRELLQEQGMQLADSHVSQGDQGQRREGRFGDAGGSSGGNVDDFSAEELDLGLNQATSLNSGIDYYA